MYKVIENRPVTSKACVPTQRVLEYVSCHWLLSVVSSPLFWLSPQTFAVQNIPFNTFLQFV